MRYWVLFSTNYDDGAFLSAEPESGPDGYKYNEGMPLIKSYPKQGDAIMCFNENYSNGIKLYDFVDSINSFHVVNSKVKNVLEGITIKNLEFLPIRIHNHQNQIASDDYFILNPLGSVDFIDMQKSEYKMNRLIKTQIKHVNKLIIDSSAIQGGGQIISSNHSDESAIYP